MLIGLTTCPHHASGNVGDQLITEAALELIEDIHGPVECEIHFRREDFSSRLDYLNSSDAIVLFGLPIDEEQTRPRYYRIAEDLDEVDPPIIPISAIHKFFPGDERELATREFETKTRRFLDRLVPNCPEGEIPVRTEWVGRVLEQNGYDAVLTGDPAWYDPEMIGQEFHRPESIDQLVFTTPHSAHYLEQAKTLLGRLTRTFPEADRIVSLHSAPTDVDRELTETAKRDGWEIHYASHDTANLELYRDSDLHVGYRKHGHLAHLRWRRPSVVLAEDSRAQGLNKTLGTAGFPAFQRRMDKQRERMVLGLRHAKPLRAVELTLQSFGFPDVIPSNKEIVAPPNQHIDKKVIEFIENQRTKDWTAYDAVKNIIDRTYMRGMKPYLQSVINS